MSNEIVIEQTHEALMNDHEKLRLCEIRFDCIVRMHDFGCRETKSATLFMPTKSLPPQWFALETSITLESVMFEDEAAIGARIKQAYSKLRAEIDKYTQK